MCLKCCSVVFRQPRHQQAIKDGAMTQKSDCSVSPERDLDGALLIDLSVKKYFIVHIL